ncbi:MAG: CdaR family protein [Alkaliphilus sp.]|nr:CdaR family protein [Alkaliphilus sp.]
MNRNIAPKIISILFALVLWIYVMSTFNPIEYRNIANIPVRLINAEELKDQKLAIKNNADFKVRVKLTGRRDEINKVLAEQIQIRADLRGYGAGVNNIPLEITVPNNVETDVTPRFIQLEFEKIIRERREVKVITSGIPRDSFVIGRLDYKPTTVWIEGAESHVNLVKNVIAELDITEKSENIASRLPLKPVNSENEEILDVDVETSYIDVSLSVDLLKSVSVKPDLQIITEDDYIIADVKVSPSNVMLRGQKDLVSGITEIATEPIKFEGLDQDRTLNVKLNLPEGVTLYKNTSITVDLHLGKIEEATYKIGKDKIVFNNINEELKVNTDDIPESIDVRIVALRDVLDSIKENNIKIAVDLNELGADKYTIELAAQLPFAIEKDIKEMHLSPKTIDIMLVEKQ